ncbi:MAG: septal ring lytic transglycosylase RlpA family lipoprotein, partial [Actinobacteria bacterium]|nr:septal ring lytic transglycosylase RlpA family lipoprotein [Actinomycetota bacterium]
ATWYRWKKGNCAHNSLPLGTRVRVTSVATGRSATCVVGDRGAFRNPTIIDLDASVFEQISPLGAGRISVVISW